MARRGHGKLTFLDLVDRSGRIQLLCDESRVGAVDVDLGDIVGAVGSPASSRRGEPSLAVDELTILSKNRSPLPDTFHGVTDTETRYRQALPRPPDERGGARAVPPAHPRNRSRSAASSTRTASSRSRRRSCNRATAARSRTRSSTHSNELDADLYLRIATELYLKRLIVGGLERVYEIGKDFRNESVSFKHQPEFTMLEWYEAYADYDDTMSRIETLVERVALETIGTTSVAIQGARDRPEGAVASRALRRRARGARAVDARRRRAASLARRARRRHGSGQGLAAARRPRLQPLRRARPDLPDDRSRLPDRALPVRAFHRRRSHAHRAVRVLRGRDGARQRVHRDQRRRGAAHALRDAVGARRGRARRPRLRRSALVRHAADGRARARDRPPRHAPLGARDDPRGDPLPGSPPGAEARLTVSS